MERRAITVEGVVQGVGFRPFVAVLARRLMLNGFVRNRSGTVLIEVEGSPDRIVQFLEALPVERPLLARIESLSWRVIPTRQSADFQIVASDSESSGPVSIPADVATCADCLAELFDPEDRRYRYPFLNCINCGPRLTIIRSVPYDRERTTMAPFVLCRDCRVEYEDPANRRYHAQPTACPVCGPHLTAIAPDGTPSITDDPVLVFAAAISNGQIGALKGLGGFHLVCDARNETAVRELRHRKGRDERPLALLIQTVDIARRLCEIEECEAALLESPRRPIVLLRKRQPSSSACRDSKADVPDSIADSVAGENPCLGIMLPSIPLHHLLLEAVHGIPLVMTSGNRSDEPTVFQDTEVVECLGQIADLILTHNRQIVTRGDDSVTRIVDHVELPVRRSRGDAPLPVRLPFECPIPILAVGGQQKNVFALGSGMQAILSHHIGDLDHIQAYQAFENDIALYEHLFQIRPKLIAHDLHPDYLATGYARRRAKMDGLQLVSVQHHHAHMASCMAENGLDEPVIGVSFDGSGHGMDETVWGGEILVGDYCQMTRAAHLRTVRMPGGEQAIHQPWRMAIAYLRDSGGDVGHAGPVSDQETRTVLRMLERGFNSPYASSCGRLFDAVAVVLGGRGRVSFEGQAAQELEWLASTATDSETYPFEFHDEHRSSSSEGADQMIFNLAPIAIDTRPLIRAILRDLSQHVAKNVIARRFHSTISAMVVSACQRIRQETRLNAVALSGGVFMNALLTEQVARQLKQEEFQVYRHRLVPPGDGGLCLGQLAIAAKQAASSSQQRSDSISPGEI